MKHEALAVIELNSIARGKVVTDAMVKKAPVEIILSRPICPGKYLIAMAGMVDPIHEALAIGKYYADYTMTDAIAIENLHPQILPAIVGSGSPPEILAVGIIETHSSPACVIAADTACKTAQIELIEIHLASGIGGKAFVTLTGTLEAVTAAIDSGVKTITSGLLVRSEIIPAPHPQFKATLY